MPQTLGLIKWSYNEFVFYRIMVDRDENTNVIIEWPLQKAFRECLISKNPRQYVHKLRP